jgi:acyl carrier protein
MPALDNVQALSPTEIAVGEIWMEALQIDGIDLEDNFFERGGDSLTTMMMLFRISEVLHVDMPPDILVDAPTLRDFCRAIDVIKAAQGAAAAGNVEIGII